MLMTLFIIPTFHGFSFKIIPLNYYDSIQIMLWGICIGKICVEVLFDGLEKDELPNQQKRIQSVKRKLPILLGLIGLTFQGALKMEQGAIIFYFLLLCVAALKVYKKIKKEKLLHILLVICIVMTVHILLSLLNDGNEFIYQMIIVFSWVTLIFLADQFDLYFDKELQIEKL